MVSRSARCCGERGRVGAFSSASTPCNAMCAVTGASAGIARANSALGCNREVDYRQSGAHPVLKSAPMGATPPITIEELAFLPLSCRQRTPVRYVDRHYEYIN